MNRERIALSLLVLVLSVSACEKEAEEHRASGAARHSTGHATAATPPSPARLAARVDATAQPSTQRTHEQHAVSSSAGPPVAHDESAHETAPSAPPTAPSGYAVLDIEPTQAARMGLATARVEQREVTRTIRTTGVVSLDETRTSHVHAKVRGWIERVMADFVGKQVKAGTPLCTIYSQEVYAAQLEYLSVLEQTSARGRGAGPFAEAEHEASQKLVAAARRRLALWDVPASEIDRLERTRQPQRTFVLTAPRTGIIVSKQALAGTFIDPGTELYVVSDVSHLWVLADVYGADVPWVRVGAPASLRFDGVDGEPRNAQVAFLPPTIEESTRTLKVRFDVDNKDNELRAGTFVTVEMSIDLGSSLAVPESAVIHAGDRAIAFVVHGTRIEPRAVELGPVTEGYYRVMRGVREGESVAVGAQFLIDSESRLRATSLPGAQHGGH
jgi:membrane fusion protein, copper/silver efflux system